MPSKQPFHISKNDKMIRLIYGNTEADCVDEKTDFKVAVEGTLVLNSTFKIVCDTEIKNVSFLNNNIILNNYCVTFQGKFLNHLFIQFHQVHL